MFQPFRTQTYRYILDCLAPLRLNCKNCPQNIWVLLLMAVTTDLFSWQNCGDSSVGPSSSPVISMLVISKYPPPWLSSLPIVWRENVLPDFLLDLLDLPLKRINAKHKSLQKFARSMLRTSFGILPYKRNLISHFLALSYGYFHLN